MDDDNIEYVEIESGSRIHINSLDMNGSIGRYCGGIGFYINNPGFNICLKKNKSIEIKSECLNEKIKSVIKSFKDEYNIPGVSIEVKREIPSHKGLGSGTQLCMGIGRGISELYDLNVSDHKIATMTGRASISGIGYGSFTYGGFIVDGGYSFGKEKEVIKFGGHSKNPPEIISNISFPEEWKIMMMIPEKNCSILPEEEDSLFAENIPIDEKEVHVICREVLMKTLPCLKRRNYEGFISSIEKISSLGTKKIEKKLNSEFYCHMNSLKEDGFPMIELTSLGPTCYSILDEKKYDIEYLYKKAKEKVKETGKGNILLASGRNTPATFKVVR